MILVVIILSLILGHHRLGLDLLYLLLRLLKLIIVVFIIIGRCSLLISFARSSIAIVILLTFLLVSLITINLEIIHNILKFSKVPVVEVLSVVYNVILG